MRAGPTPARFTRFAPLDVARGDLSLSKVATAFGLAACSMDPGEEAASPQSPQNPVTDSFLAQNCH